MQAVYYRESNGIERVNDFIDALPPERQEELDFKIGLLNRLTSTDPPLPFLHNSQVDGQLRELRCHYGRDLDRIFYQRSWNLFVLLHAIEKRPGGLRPADIDLAKARFGSPGCLDDEAVYPRRTVSLPPAVVKSVESPSVLHQWARPCIYAMPSATSSSSSAWIGGSRARARPRGSSSLDLE
jgi:phage-related protein